MGLLDRIRGQKKKPKSKPRPKRVSKKTDPQGVVKSVTPRVKREVSNEDLMRELKALYLLLSKNHIEVREGLMNLGRLTSPERLDLKMKAIDMLNQGYKRSDISRDLQLPQSTVYRWLKDI